MGKNIFFWENVHVLTCFRTVKSKINNGCKLFENKNWSFNFEGWPSLSHSTVKLFCQIPSIEFRKLRILSVVKSINILSLYIPFSEQNITVVSCKLSGANKLLKKWKHDNWNWSNAFTLQKRNDIDSKVSEHHNSAHLAYPCGIHRHQDC